jgi:thioredoxin-like negative regulator of GroEL
METTPKEIEHVKELAEKDFETEVLGATLPVVLDFYSADGAACKALIPRYGAVAQTYEGKVRFFKILGAANQALSEKLKITVAPSLLFFQDGKEVGARLSGEEIKRTALKAQVDALLKP